MSAVRGIKSLAQQVRTGPFRHRGFRLYASAQGVSLIGDGMEAVALSFAVLARFAGAGTLALVLAAYTFAMVALPTSWPLLSCSPARA
jgi:hypothetical protein